MKPVNLNNALGDIYNPHIPCELQGGHIWVNILTKNDLDQDIKLTVCQQCKKVKSTFGE